MKAKFESVTNSLQDDHIIWCEDLIWCDYSRFSNNVEIFRFQCTDNSFKYFLNAIVKVLKGSELDLMNPEKIAIEKFIKYSDHVQ
jgi:hypothetical protein